MKKKKTQEARPPPPEPTIHDHALFFDRLVDLIPPRFYLSTDDGEDRPWYPGLSKTQRAVAKKQTRENTKKSRRARLDPEKSSSTLSIIKDRVFSEKSELESGGGGEEGKKLLPTISINRSVTYEELRERLHRRLEELRSTRNTRPTSNFRPERGGKRKREGKSAEEDDPEATIEDKKNPESVPVDLSFGQVKLGDEEEIEGKKRRKKKMSKLQELEKAKRLQEMKKDPEKGEVVSKKFSWKAAVDRAAGVKVHDDPKLLKESLKKEKKRRQKSAQKWKERTESREKLLAEKQKKRTDNIKERIHLTKLKKIEKREKKLMRPGFEGRKEGFVNTPAA